MNESFPARCYECPVLWELDDTLQCDQVEAGFLIEAAESEIITEEHVVRYLDNIGECISEEQEDVLLGLLEDDTPETIELFSRSCYELADEILEDADELESDIELMRDACRTGPWLRHYIDADGVLRSEFRCLSPLVLTGKIVYHDGQETS